MGVIKWTNSMIEDESRRFTSVIELENKEAQLIKIFEFLRGVNGVMRSYDESVSVTIYDQSIAVSSLTTAGTSITLPSSGTYDSANLEVYLNGIRLDVVLDYNYVGTAPRTQIQLTFDVDSPDVLRFRVDRAA